MVAFANNNGRIVAAMIGSFGNDGLPAAPTPANALALPGQLFQAGTPTITVNETTITSECRPDYVERDTSATLDVTMCEIVVPEFLAMMTGTPVVGANPDLDPALLAAMGLNPGDAIGWVAQALGSTGGGCCPGVAGAAAGRYMVTWRCVGKCDRSAWQTADGSPVWSMSVYKITDTTVTAYPNSWDSTATSDATWTMTWDLGNANLADFAGVFPGAVGGGDVIAPFGAWLTTVQPPFEGDCGCELSDGGLDPANLIDVTSAPVAAPIAAPAIVSN